MESILAFSLTQNMSDVHLSSGENIFIRQNGQLISVNNRILSGHQLEQKLFSILTAEQLARFKADKQLDFAYSHPSFGRFRVNLFYQQRGISAVFRYINPKIVSLDDIGTPDIIKTLTLKTQGLILITGATGSGKSTTLVAMLEYINQHQSKHIITLEDPIEFIYQNNCSLIQQREVGTHCLDYASGLKSILRQDPDVIVIGELRDRQTITAALQAAETGHIVLATLHTNSCIATINRIVDVFPNESSNFIRTQLAHSLQAVICQQLINDDVLGRKAIFEIMINIPAVSNLIQEGKIKQIFSIMQTGGQYGMKIFD